MNMKWNSSASNGHRTGPLSSETATSSAKVRTTAGEHLEVQRQHQQWLNQARKAQVKNRRLLALLSRLESIVLDRDATMASLVDRIETHDTQIKNSAPAAVDPTDWPSGSSTVHRSYRAEHAAVHEIFDHFEADEEKFNGQIEGVIEALLRAL